LARYQVRAGLPAIGPDPYNWSPTAINYASMRDCAVARTAATVWYIAVILLFGVLVWYVATSEYRAQLPYARIGVR
jgi:hypothetical protein